MLNLSATFKYYICTLKVTLRYRHRGLRDYIKSKLHKDPTNGDVYIFLSRDFKRMRVHYHNHGGAILTEKILQNSRFVTPYSRMQTTCLSYILGRFCVHHGRCNSPEQA